MARYQNGSIRIEQRKDGPTWVYRFQITRSDGKRVEHTTAIGLVSGIRGQDKCILNDLKGLGGLLKYLEDIEREINLGWSSWVGTGN